MIYQAPPPLLVAHLKTVSKLHESITIGQGERKYLRFNGDIGLVRVRVAEFDELVRGYLFQSSQLRSGTCIVRPRGLQTEMDHLQETYRGIVRWVLQR